MKYNHKIGTNASLPVVIHDRLAKPIPSIILEPPTLFPIHASRDTYNLSYHSMILIWAQVLYASTRGPMLVLGVKDNVNPRSTIDELEKSGKYSPKLIDKLRRRQAAHQNGYEALPMYIAAVVG